MAVVTIPIYRQNYALSGESPSEQYTGIAPNEITAAMTPQALQSASDGNVIEADFKDHKTIFAFVNSSGASASVTFKAGNTYQGVNDLVLSVPSGTSYIWLDSAKFVDKVTGKIMVTTTASQSLAAYGVEMR